MSQFLPHSQLHGLKDAEENFDAITDLGITSGTGAPTFQAKKGDYYLRRDTPATANQRIYVNTADGSNWTALI